jgi:LacI family transcriptional regulator
MKPRRSKHSITIQDVARTAGVSVSTVSRVLNDKEDVSLETYEHVKQVIAELGYASNLAARSMRQHRTNVIGLIMPDVAQSYPVTVMKGVNRAIAELDYDLIVYTSGDARKHYTADRERHFVALLNNSITDGVIVVTPAATRFNTAGPVIAVDPHNECPDYPSISSTNREGAVTAVSHLLNLGHRRIGFIGGRGELQSAIHRRQGYEETLKQTGIPLDPQLILPGDFTVETGRECGLQLLSLPNPPTAIFAANDQSALGVYQAAHSLGLCIPEDLSVIGFDDIPEAGSASPGLTTIDQSVEQMGYIATQLLVKLIEEEPLESELYKIPTKLVIRSSCRTAPLNIRSLS